MWWQRKTSIEVKTRDDLVAALKTAPDEIIVEGDDKLVEEAEKLITESREKAAERQIPGVAGNYSSYDRYADRARQQYREQQYNRERQYRDAWTNDAAKVRDSKYGGNYSSDRRISTLPPAPIGPPLPASSGSLARFHGRTIFGSIVIWALKGILFYLLAWLSLIIFYRLYYPTSTSVPPPLLPSPPSLPSPSLPSPPLPSPEGGGVNYVSLAWVVVAIVAMALAYRVIMKAMQGERDVEISWKITEKVSGKLVITKVQKTTKVSTRATRKTKAA
jgi:hypothetical protein